MFFAANGIPQDPQVAVGQAASIARYPAFPASALGEDTNCSLSVDRPSKHASRRPQEIVSDGIVYGVYNVDEKDALLAVFATIASTLTPPPWPLGYFSEPVMVASVAMEWLFLALGEISHPCHGLSLLALRGRISRTPSFDRVDITHSGGRLSWGQCQCWG